VDQPEFPRGTRWAAGLPHASLLVCAGLVGVQVFASPALSKPGMAYHENELVTALLNVPMFICFFLPLGAAYGIHVGMAQLVVRGSKIPPIVWRTCCSRS